VRGTIEKQSRRRAFDLDLDDIGRPFRRLRRADPRHGCRSVQQDRHEQSRHFGLTIAALRLLETLGIDLPAAAAGIATAAVSSAAKATDVAAEITAAAVSAKVSAAAREAAPTAAVVFVDDVAAIQDLDALDAGAAEADAERLVAAEFVGRLEEDLAVAFERGVALTALHVALDLQTLDGGELVVAADGCARRREQ
jgi:hypothetical protein